MPATTADQSSPTHAGRADGGSGGGVSGGGENAGGGVAAAPADGCQADGFRAGGFRAGGVARPLRTIRWLGALGGAVVLGLLALGFLVLLDGYREVWSRAESAAANLAVAIERDIARVFVIQDSAIRGTIEALRQPDLDLLRPELRSMALFDRAAVGQHLGAIVVLDPQGTVRLASSAGVLPMPDLSDRDYFTVHRDHPDAGLFISLPYLSRVRGGGASIAVSRRLDDQEGRFAGVVAGALRLDHFHDLFRTLDLGPGGSVSLLRADGRLLAQGPLHGPEASPDLSASPAFQRFMRAEGGRFVAEASPDGIQRLHAFRNLRALPLVLSVAVGVDDVLAAWRTKAVTFGLILAALCAGLAALCLLFRREMLRRLAVERQLTAAAADLSLAARTDGLTGLANRRHFDAVLEQEWRRAAREGTPLSLLMLDLDCFKAFNDRYGHPAGDACLRAVAEALRVAARRPGDLAARYGGEELAMVLPCTDRAGALHLAECARAAIEALGLMHAGNAAGVVTISVGCATLAVTPALCASGSKALLCEADRALYEAKRGGRNRVASPVGPPQQGGQGPVLDEAARLAAVDRYRQPRGGPCSEELDRIARLTAGLLGAPIGLVSLLGQDTQVLAGRHGLSIESTPRSVSFCAHTITDSVPMVVPDATADRRFADNPLVLGAPDIRFYAGAPLISADGGHRLGALCIIDRVPRAGLDGPQLALLTDLAALTVDALERARQARQDDGAEAGAGQEAARAVSA